jgi:3-oxoacyl-[acyl-carrier protein] reductase
MSSNRVALVTGASRGIGRAVALSLADCRFQVLVNYAHSQQAALQLKDEILQRGVEAEILQADISLAEDQIRLVEFMKSRFGRIDALVNNAGVAPKVRQDLLETSQDSFDQLIAINLRGPFFLTQRVARWMIALRTQLEGYSPSIINISSISAYTSSPSRAEYCISKAGVSMMSQLYADRLAEHGIPVFEIRPGIIRTDMTAGVHEKYDKLIAEGLTPIRRWGRPEDVGKAVAAIVQGFLPFSTGEVLNVDGGFHMRRL